MEALGKVLGRINSDAKTDEVEPETAPAEDPKKPPIGWIVAGGVLIAAAAAFAVVLVVRMERKKKDPAATDKCVQQRKEA